MSAWKEYRLGDISKTIQTGPFGSQLHQSDYVDDGIPCIMPKNIGQHLNINCEEIAKVKPEDLNRLSRYKVIYGDIVYSRRGDIEKCAYITKEQTGWLCGTGCLNVRINEDLADSKFIAYYLSLPNTKSWLKKSAVGTTMLNLNTSILADVPITMPSLDEQRAIASILSSLDSKIENNRKICANLEAQAQALFKHWFIDFAPFKDGKFVESELGMIPEGWRVGKLGDVTEFLNGFAFKSSSFVSKGKYKVITIKAVQDGKLITDSADEIEDLSLNIPSHCVLKIGDILLSLTGNVGRVCIVTQDNLVLNQRVCILNPRNLIDRGYVYTLSRTKLLKTRMINIAKGTAQANLSPVETSKLSIVVPPRYILDKFGIIANEYMSEIISAYQENQRLSSLRDTLLPKLMSGEIKV